MTSQHILLPFFLIHLMGKICHSSIDFRNIYTQNKTKKQSNTETISIAANVFYHLFLDYLPFLFSIIQCTLERVNISLFVLLCGNWFILTLEYSMCEIQINFVQTKHTLYNIKYIHEIFIYIILWKTWDIEIIYFPSE